LKLIIAITGASGVIYGKRLLEICDEKKIETYLIISKAAEEVVNHELKDKNFTQLSSHHYKPDNLLAPLTSGSHKVEAMIIVPASMKTVAAIATGYSENLITRAADVQLKEKRKLIIVPRETPLHEIHLRNLMILSQLGAIILPAMPGFYHNPKTVNEMIDFIVGKILDQIGIRHELYRKWT
jgi:4-hydroxy-3-polyprenylbenzoate decarboxylase